AARPRRRVLPRGAAALARALARPALVPELVPRRVRAAEPGPGAPPLADRAVRDPPDQRLVRPVGPRLLLAASLGGAAGALLRHLLDEVAPDGAGFPWTTFAINLAGSFLLALLPALAGVRRHRVLA